MMMDERQKLTVCQNPMPKSIIGGSQDHHRCHPQTDKDAGMMAVGKVKTNRNGDGHECWNPAIFWKIRICHVSIHLIFLRVCLAWLRMNWVRLELTTCRLKAGYSTNWVTNSDAVPISAYGCDFRLDKRLPIFSHIPVCYLDAPSSARATDKASNSSYSWSTKDSLRLLGRTTRFNKRFPIDDLHCPKGGHLVQIYS